MAAGLTRRDFLSTSAAVGAGFLLSSSALGATRETTLQKALIGTPDETLLKKWKAAGFQGYESTKWQVSVAEATAARKTAESLGMQIHSVIFGWDNLNEGPTAVAAGVAKMETALRAAQAYGASTVLYVPCRIHGMAVPKPEEFNLRFDEKTGHLKQAVSGDNSKYEDYIEAHNRAVDATREGVALMIPTAKKTGVIIALENVWNNLWVRPEIFASFVQSFDSPWVRAYFDIGNHVKYGAPQNWIRTLGKLIVKCHVKDFKLAAGGPSDGKSKFCDIREGSVDWPAVRKALDEIGYSGWLTLEGSNLSLPEASKRMDLIIAGK